MHKLLLFLAQTFFQQNFKFLGENTRSLERDRENVVDQNNFSRLERDLILSLKELFTRNSFFFYRLELIFFFNGSLCDAWLKSCWKPKFFSSSFWNCKRWNRWKIKISNCVIRPVGFYFWDKSPKPHACKRSKVCLQSAWRQSVDFILIGLMIKFFSYFSILD